MGEAVAGLLEAGTTTLLVRSPQGSSNTTIGKCTVSERQDNTPIPPWRRQQATQPELDSLPGEDDPLSTLERALRTPGIAWALIIGFAGGFGFGAVLLILVLSMFKKPIEGPYMWYVYGGIAVAGFILWSIFLSRIRVYRSQAQDPDFAEFEQKSQRRKKRSKRSKQDRAEQETVDADDEDDEPWL